MKKTTLLFALVFSFLLSIPNLYAADLFDVDNSSDQTVTIDDTSKELEEQEVIQEENGEVAELENQEEEKNIKEELKEDIKELKEDAKSWWEKLIAAVKENVIEPAKGLWERIVEGVKEIGSAIKNIFTGNKTEAAAVRSETGKAQDNKNTENKGGLAGAIEDLANGIKNTVNDIKNDVNGLVKDVKDGVEGTTTEVKDKTDEAKKSVTDLVSDIKNSVNDVVNSVKDGVESVKSAITGKETKTIRTCETTEIKMPSGADNYCGQFAMTALLRALGKEVKEEEIYNETNPSGIFTAPTTIVEYLNKRGVCASSKNNASLNDLVSQIDKGYPVMCLVNTKFDNGGTGKATGAHWVCIYGYEKDKDGNVVSLKMRDAYWNNSTNKSSWDKDPLPVDEFLQMWESPLGKTSWDNFFGLTGASSYKNLMIAVDGTKEESSIGGLFNVNFGTATEDNVAGCINDLWTGWKNKDISQLGSGVVKGIFGIPSAIVGGISNGINSGSDSLMNWGSEKMDQGGFLNTILGGGAYAIGGAGKAVGTVGKTVGNVVGSVGSVLGDGVKAIGDGAKSLWNGAKNLWNSIF